MPFIVKPKRIKKGSLPWYLDPVAHCETCDNLTSVHELINEAENKCTIDIFFLNNKPETNWRDFGFR